MATKVKSIPLLGLTTNPTDLNCDDGNLAAAINVFHENGGIESAEHSCPKIIENLGNDTIVLYQHKAMDVCNFIKRNTANNTYFYTEKDSASMKLDIEFAVYGRIRISKGEEKISSVIKEGDVVDLTSLEDSGEFDVTMKPILTLNGKDVSASATRMTYSRKRTGKSEKIVVYDEPIDYFGKLVSLPIMTTSSKEEDLTENGEFHMIVSIEYKGNIVSRTFNFKYRVDSTSVPSSIPSYVPNAPVYITNALTFDEIEGHNVLNVESFGNILIFFCENDTHYYIYKYGGYSFLGNHIPKLDISFSLEGHYYHNHTNLDASKGSYDNWDDYATNSGLTLFKPKDLKTNVDDQNDAVTASLAEANSFVHDTMDDGYFNQPFLVRYAYRLYDGSHVMPSAPVLMIPSNKNNPIVHVSFTHWQNSDNEGRMMAHGVACKLLFKSGGVDLQNWKDIISGVDIFVSSPFYTYRQDGAKIRDYCVSVPDINTLKLYPLNNAAIFKIGASQPQYYRDSRSLFSALRIRNGKVIAQPPYRFNSDKLLDKNNESIGAYLNNNGAVISSCYAAYSDFMYFSLDVKSKSELDKEIRECNSFYLLKEYKIEDISTKSDSYKEVDIPKGKLVSIETEETLVEDYESFHNIVGRSSESYNNRLSLFNITKEYFEGFNISTMSQDVSGEYYVTEEGDVESRISQYSNYVCVVTIDSGEKLFTKCNSVKDKFGYDPRLSYLFYPDPNAKGMDIYFEKDGHIYYSSYKLEEHPFMNASFYSRGVNMDTMPSPIKSEYSSLEEVINEFNKDEMVIVTNEIRTSETNNPFAFRASNIETIGNGKIIALVPQAVALSEGQFGAYPMICFTTDGIWALSVNSTGGWSAKQPFSRDVVLNEDAGNILQLDRQVMFASERGLMLVNGSNVECISEIFDGHEDSFNVIKSNAVKKAHNEFMTESVLPLTDILATRADATKDNLFNDFKKFIGNAVFLYDYAHQRIIIGNEDYPFAYVYNMKDRIWTSINQKVTSAVNSYPNCYAMTNHNGSNLLVDFSATDGVAEEVGLPSDGFIMTRPIKLGDSTALKTIRTINIQGVFERSHVDMVLLGCSDNAMKNWFVLSSCKGSRMPFKYGTPFKYFRLCLITRLTEGESISSATIEYEVKETNKLRQ